VWATISTHLLHIGHRFLECRRINICNKHQVISPTHYNLALKGQISADKGATKSHANFGAVTKISVTTANCNSHIWQKVTQTETSHDKQNLKYAHASPFYLAQPVGRIAAIAQ
jgi:hypothetical protein